MSDRSSLRSESVSEGRKVRTPIPKAVALNKTTSSLSAGKRCEQRRVLRSAEGWNG